MVTLPALELRFSYAPALT